MKYGRILTILFLIICSPGLLFGSGDKPKLILQDGWHYYPGYTKVTAFASLLNSELVFVDDNDSFNLDSRVAGVIMMVGGGGSNHRFREEAEYLMKIHSFVKKGGRAILFLGPKSAEKHSNLFVDLFGVALANEKVFSSTRVKGSIYIPFFLPDQLIGTPGDKNGEFSPIYIVAMDKDSPVSTIKSSETGKNRIVAIKRKIGDGEIIIATGLFYWSEGSGWGYVSRMFYSDKNIDLLGNEEGTVSMLNWLLGK